MSTEVIAQAPRVVGVDSSNEILWTPKKIPDRPDLNYARKRIYEMTLASSGPFKERFLGFFATYLAESSGGHEKEYNCHLFGRWMIGESLVTPENGTDGPEDVIADGVRTDALEREQRGVVGGLWHNHPDAAHSVIGIGEDLSLHVEGWQGPLRITSPEQAVDKYISAYHRASPSYCGGVYVANPKAKA